jgi:hypothetical protein
VSHPGDHGRFRLLLDWDTLRPGHRAAAERRGVIGHSPCQPIGEVGVSEVERQECQDGTVEVLDVLGLGRLTPSGYGLLAFGIVLGGPLGL